MAELPRIGGPVTGAQSHNCIGHLLDDRFILPGEVRLVPTMDFRSCSAFRVQVPMCHSRRPGLRIPKYLPTRVFVGVYFPVREDSKGLV